MNFVKIIEQSIGSKINDETICFRVEVNDFKDYFRRYEQAKEFYFQSRTLGKDVKMFIEYQRLGSSKDCDFLINFIED